MLVYMSQSGLLEKLQAPLHACINRPGPDALGCRGLQQSCGSRVIRRFTLWICGMDGKAGDGRLGTLRKSNPGEGLQLGP